MWSSNPGDWVAKNGWYRPAGSADAPQTTAFLARTSGLSGTETAAYKALINGMVTDGIFSLFDAIYILATKDTATAALNLVGTSFTLTTTGSPTFTADRGYVGASGAHLDTGFNPTTQIGSGAQMASNNASVWAWALGSFTSGTDYGSAVNLSDASNNFRIYSHYSDNNYYFNINSSGFPGAGTSTGSFLGATRTGSGTSTPYQNATAGSNDASAQVIANANIWLINSGSSDPFQGQLSFAAFGAALNSTQEAALYARVHAYMQSVAGAP